MDNQKTQNQKETQNTLKETVYHLWEILTNKIKKQFFWNQLSEQHKEQASNEERNKIDEHKNFEIQY